MKSLHRYCSALLCFALLLGVSSVPVKAVDVEEALPSVPYEHFAPYVVDRNNINPIAYEQLGEYAITQYGFVATEDTHWGAYTFNFFPCNDTVEKYEKRQRFGGTYTLRDGVATYELTIVRTDGTPILYGGETADFRFDDFYFSIYNETAKLYYRDAVVKVQAIYSDNGSSSMLPATYTHDGAIGSFILKGLETEKDVMKLKVTVTFNDFNSYNFVANDTSILTMYYGEYADCNFTVSRNMVDANTGLLASLIEWVKSIKQGVTDVFVEINSGFSYVINQLVELPALIWQKFEDGIKFLFLPTEEYIVNYKQSMDTLLADKFGAVYEVVNLTFESWDRITANDEQNIISVEEVSIPLPDNNSFSFGGYDVPIVPNGFEWLATIVKSLVGVVCTVSFVNGLRKRYDEIMER